MDDDFGDFDLETGMAWGTTKTSTTSRTTTSTTTAYSPPSRRYRGRFPVTVPDLDDDVFDFREENDMVDFFSQSASHQEVGAVDEADYGFSPSSPAVAGFGAGNRFPGRGSAGLDLNSQADMYVTPPDTDIYSIPRVLAPMPQKVFLTKHYRNRRLVSLKERRGTGEMTCYSYEPEGNHSE
uniref:Uncharacterized protein n=1 Tax=Oryza punctata TaxID=4537 RepID=A0A0E0MBN0_ORYPU